MSWTDQRIDQLKTLWEKGLTASQIADELGGVSRNAVIGKAHRLGLKSRPSPVKANEPEKKVAPKKAVAPAKPMSAAPVRERVAAPSAAAPNPNANAAPQSPSNAAPMPRIVSIGAPAASCAKVLATSRRRFPLHRRAAWFRPSRVPKWPPRLRCST